MPRSVAAILLALLAVGASSPALAECQPGWSAGKGVFHTDERVERGDELRIRIQQAGKGELWLLRWEGKKRKSAVLERWSGASLRPGQVLRHSVASGGRLALRVAGDKQRPPKGQQAERCFHRLRFGGGWVVDVKLVDGRF